MSRWMGAIVGAAFGVTVVVVTVVIGEASSPREPATWAGVLSGAAAFGAAIGQILWTGMGADDRPQAQPGGTSPRLSTPAADRPPASPNAARLAVAAAATLAGMATLLACVLSGTLSAHFGVAPFLATGFLLFVFAGLVVRLHQIPLMCFPRGCCQFCGYDLRATPGRCPECGTSAK